MMPLTLPGWVSRAGVSISRPLPSRLPRRCGRPLYSLSQEAEQTPSMSQFVAAMPDPPANVLFKTLDFFSFDIPEGGFQVAYDYTFLCALPPSLREPWGRRYAELIAPGGEAEPFRQGPPTI